MSSVSSTSTPTSTSTSASSTWPCHFHCSHLSKEWTPLHTRPKASGGGGPPEIQEEAPEQELVTIPIQEIIHTQEEEHQDPMGQEEHSPQEEAIQEAIQRQHSSRLHSPTAVRRSRQSRWHPADHTSRTSVTTLRSMGSIRQIQESTTEAFIALQLQEL